MQKPIFRNCNPSDKNHRPGFLWGGASGFEFADGSVRFGNVGGIVVGGFPGSCGKERTKRAAVLAALDDFSRRGRMREIAMRLGNSETFMTATDLETLRLQEKPE